MSYQAQYIPQVKQSSRPVWFWLASVVIAFTILGLIVGAPLAASNNSPRAAFVIYHAFGTFCHQIPERSFFVAGHQFAVCARCTGLYSGFALVLLLYPLIKPIRSTALLNVKWLFLSAIPMLIDFSLTFFGLWENTHTSRLSTGLLLGGVTVFYVVPGLTELGLRAEAKSDAIKSSPFTMPSAEAVASAPSDYSAPERRI